ncbi:serine hydrolase domain-containing protein [Odoribacter lunatus]|uniref:serine hydrolase domain-containing protein n=1 Tax=Odoribacter lunatus TaxID=2941335 RepID=UPI002040823A|nr:serine hydrolase [Odoribacter lunatus]
MSFQNKIPRWQKISSGILLVIAIIFLIAPVYVREALIHWYPDISDTYLFESHVVAKADTCWEWPEAKDYNTYRLDKTDSLYLDEYGTVAFLVIQDDSIRYEEYRDSWTPLTLSNLFSATKSIVGLLIGIAHDEGYIKSLDDKVGDYLPEFKEGKRADVSIRNLLTMSSGLNWDESYSSLFSKTTQAYYGDNIRELVMNLEVEEEPGKRYSYKSGDTQLLSLLLEAATGQTISDYAHDKLWQPMQACTDALWNLDKKGGDEKAYCCFNTTARDVARFARLILRNGDWNGRQLVSEEYMQEAITPAVYLENEFGDGALDYYGFQIWIVKYGDMRFPAFRGLGGQYIFAIPQKNAIVVRLGHDRSTVYEREVTTDMKPYLDIAFKILK